MEERRRPISLGELFAEEGGFPITAGMFDRVHSWSTDDKPVTLREYIAARTPEAAKKLGIEIKEDPSIVDVYKLDDEAVWKITVFQIPTMEEAYKLDIKELGKRLMEDRRSGHHRYPGIGYDI